jgi:hypothetical protein
MMKSKSNFPVMKSLGVESGLEIQQSMGSRQRYP